MLAKKALPQKPAEWDGNWRLVEYDPFSDQSEWYLYNNDNTVTFRKIQHNVDALLDSNTERFNDHLNSRWGDGRIVASIPTTVFEDLGLDKAFAQKDQAFIKKVLNNSDNARLRTFKGNI
tara:strand:- start:1195 stop:1554 length:360 start_codon:yes stop_codon:yes gene_type:complete